MSKNMITTIPSHLLEHYNNIQIDMYLLFINVVEFFSNTSRGIGFIHCQPVLSKHDRFVSNALRMVVQGYGGRLFKVVTASGDPEFNDTISWLKIKLIVKITTCDAYLHVPRAENTIKVFKERLQCFQSQMEFNKFPRIFTIEIIKATVMLGDSFPRKTLAHKTNSHLRIMYERGFNSPIANIGDLVIAYDDKANDKTSKPREFFALYISPSDNGTDYILFELKTKKVVSTPKCIPKPMTEDSSVKIVIEMGKEEHLQGRM